MSHPTRRDLLKIGAASVFSWGQGLNLIQISMNKFSNWHQSLKPSVETDFPKYKIQKTYPFFSLNFANHF